MKFEIGEIVLWFSPNYPEYHGMEVTVTSGYRDLYGKHGMMGERGYSIDNGLPPIHKNSQWASLSCNLRKLPPKDTKTSWKELKEIYKPQILETA